jgi:hypothetical protein
MPTKKQDSFAASASDERLKTPIRPSDTVSVAWECAHCGKRHLWKWQSSSAVWASLNNRLSHFHCVDKGGCMDETLANIRQIGRDAYAACWVR